MAAGATHAMLPVPGLRPRCRSGERRAQMGSRVPHPGLVLAAGLARNGPAADFPRPTLGLEPRNHSRSACPPVLCECLHNPPLQPGERF